MRYNIISKKEVKTIFIIVDRTTHEVLADNLRFVDVPELYKAYCDFYYNHNIDVVGQEVVKTETTTEFALQSKAEFAEYMQYANDVFGGIAI